MIANQFTFKESEDFKTINDFHPDIKNKVIESLKNSIQKKEVELLVPKKENLVNIQLSICGLELKILDKKFNEDEEGKKQYLDIN